MKLGDDLNELLGGDDPTSSLFASDLTESPAGVFTELLAGDDLPELFGPLRLSGRVFERFGTVIAGLPSFSAFPPFMWF